MAREYKYIVLNQDKAETTENLLNEAAELGFVIREVVQGFRTSDLSHRFAAVIMEKTA